MKCLSLRGIGAAIWLLGLSFLTRIIESYLLYTSYLNPINLVLSLMSFCTCVFFVLSLYTSYITCDKLLSLTPVEYAHYISPPVYASEYSIMIADFLYWHLTLLLYEKPVAHLYQRTSMLPPDRLLIYLQILLSST